ncbi:sporulation-control protein [Geodermatophilus dictyosporus]|uniref:Sporulation-control protein n=1 Tax=Geodermatophilus dictyosporus TaxID=1523247 RepID=A0A1I5JF45_9ACTN|nr:sporulation protein [Geodermatophilus dictyosporus]SFO71448.1 sporulation-control protein [Geodermatophilus dictyosporus]
MAFRNLMAKLGAGNASVDTVLDSPVTTPGGTVTGTVHLTGGQVAQDIAECRVSLQARVEVESGDHEWREDVVFGTAVVAGAGRIEPGVKAAVPFSFPVPWQCPFTAVDGWTLRGVSIGLRTRVDIPGASDPGDLDAVVVEPLPVQRTVIAALSGLGFAFRGADVEKGRLAGSDLPFYQEVEFAPPSSLRGRVNELEVTFLAGPHGVEVVLEVDRRGGLFTEGRDVGARLQLRHTDTDVSAVAAQLDAAVRQLGARRGWL